MTTTPLSVVEILARFEQPPRLSNPPTYEEIEQLLRLIQRNAAKIHTHRGGGQHGHLGTTMSPADYLAITGTAWTPAVPPAILLNIPNGTTALQERNIRANHERETNEFLLEQNVLAAIKSLIVDSVPHEFLDEIRHTHSDLQNLTVPQIFQHLFQQPSALITLEDVEQRRDQIETQKYSLEEEPTVYFKRLQDYQLYATRGGDTITNQNLMTMALRHFRQTGHFNRACHEWTDRIRAQPVQNTWANFKVHFTNARTRAKQDAASNSNAAYQAANNVIQRQAVEFERMHNESQRSIQQLTAQMNLMMQQAPPTPAMPPPFCPPIQSEPLQAYNMQYQQPYYPPPFPPYMYAAQHESNKENADIRKQLEELTAALAKNGKRRTGNRNRQPKTKRANNNDNYCWTHGYDVADQHTSATCKNPAAGHQPTATKANPMNGSTKDKNLSQ